MKILLIANNSFSKITNNGKTYESILRGFDKTELAQLFFSLNESPDFEYCENYYKISDIDVLKSVLTFKSTCGRRIDKFDSKVTDRNTKDYQICELFKKIISPFFRDILWWSNRWNTGDLRRWCNEFSPDIIMFVGGMGFSNRIALFLSGYLDVPLVTFYTDDYVIHSIKRNWLYQFNKWRINRIYSRTINRSDLLFAIGDKMAKEYSSYFGKQFYPIMNSVPVVAYKPYLQHDPIRISYFGGLHLNRWQMISRLGALLPNSAVIDVYSMSRLTPEMEDSFAKSKIRFCGSAIGDMLLNKIQESDILLHVESDDKYLRQLTSLSVSTKIPEYLMAGKPILGYGPAEVASMQLLTDNCIGEVISSDLSQSDILSKLHTFINNFEYRATLSRRGYDFAINRFDNNKIISEFASLMQQVVNEKKHYQI